jgi:hypothetical protein
MNCCTLISQLSSLHSTSWHLCNSHFLTRIYFPLCHFTSLHFLFPPHLHFTSVVTFLTLFQKLLGYRSVSLKHLQAVGSRVVQYFLKRNIFWYLSFDFCSWFSYHDRLCSDSMAFVICHLYPSKPIILCTLWRERICKLCFCAMLRFPVGIISVMCKFRCLVLLPVLCVYLSLSVRIPARCLIFKNRSH